MSEQNASLNVQVTFRGIDSTDALKDYAIEKVTNSFVKYLRESTDVHVVLSVEKRDHTAEVFANSKTFQVTSKATTEDLYSAVDKVVDTLATQLRKQKEKLVAQRYQAAAD